MPELRRNRLLTTEAQLHAARAEPSRSPMARAADSLPPRPYDRDPGVISEAAPTVLSGRRPEPAPRGREYTAADLMRYEESAPDGGPGWEWYRELADDDF